MSGEPATVTNAVRHGFVRTDGLWLHHLDHGGTGAPILLLHGVTGSAWDWHDVGAGIGSIGSVLALDLRGHGDSEWSPSGAYASADNVDDLEARIEAMGVHRADLVGYSWGALISIGYAARRPDRVRRMVIVDVEPSFEQTETDIPPLSVGFPSLDEVMATQRAFNPNAPEDLLRVVAHAATRPGPGGAAIPKHDPYFAERWPFRSDDRWDELGSLTMPTLLVHAEASFVRCEVMQRMAEEIPRSELVHLPEANHVVPVDDPQGLIPHLLAFLR